MPLTSIGAQDPDWSPDGTHIAFTGPGSKIYVMNADGSNPTPLTAGIDGFAAWNPAGTKIAYRHRVTFGNDDTFVMNADGTNQTDITNLNNSDEASPHWSPDGAHVATQGGLDPETDIYVVTATGTGLTNVSMMPGRNNNPRWSLDSSKITFEGEVGGMLEI